MSQAVFTVRPCADPIDLDALPSADTTEELLALEVGAVALVDGVPHRRVGLGTDESPAEWSDVTVGLPGSWEIAGRDVPVAGTSRTRDELWGGYLTGEAAFKEAMELAGHAGGIVEVSA